MVTVLHLKDSVCNMETHIISQYAKMAGQAVYNLQVCSVVYIFVTLCTYAKHFCFQRCPVLKETS